MEVLSPAGSPEAVIAAVQNGADAVYIGFGGFNARRNAKNFTEEEFIKAVRYCHIRGCKVYATLNTLVNDREIDQAVGAAHVASECGADGIIIQDLGLVRVLREALPDIPLHASTQMSLHNLAGVEAAADMGLTRAVLARELSFEEIKFITQNASIEIEVFVHGALCFCHSGQCYMSSLIGRRSGNRGLCAQPCRLPYSLGGRLDDNPLSLKDSCLADKLLELEAAGVASAKIEGRMKRPEYVAVVTGIYSKLLKEHRMPTPEELQQMEDTFSRDGFTQGYYTGDKADMNGMRGEVPKDLEKMLTSVRKGYAEGELRRVPVHFYTVAEKGKPVQAIAFDDEGHKAAAFGMIPERARQQGITNTFLAEQMYKTGGTPYYCVENLAKADPNLFLPAKAVNELRRDLIARLSESRAQVPERRSGEIPPMPEQGPRLSEPKVIFQVRTAEQLTEELAELNPAHVYVPVTELAENPDCIRPFTERGTVPAVILPRVITDDQVQDVKRMLGVAAEHGVEEALVGNLGHIFLARGAGMKMRGDFGLNAFNSYMLDVLRSIGFLSATASFELRLAQIREMHKPLDTEMIVYGRLPLMVSDQCVIRSSSGHCSCRNPAELADRMGSIFPVVKEYGCRNVIYNAHKLYLADKKADIITCGLWGMRMLFSTETPRECAEVAKGYFGLTDYKPNVLTRGLYFRGVD